MMWQLLQNELWLVTSTSPTLASRNTGGNAISVQRRHRLAQHHLKKRLTMAATSSARPLRHSTAQALLSPRETRPGFERAHTAAYRRPVARRRFWAFLGHHHVQRRECPGRTPAPSRTARVAKAARGDHARSVWESGCSRYRENHPEKARIWVRAHPVPARGRYA